MYVYMCVCMVCTTQHSCWVYYMIRFSRSTKKLRQPRCFKIKLPLENKIDSHRIQLFCDLSPLPSLIFTFIIYCRIYKRRPAHIDETFSGLLYRERADRDPSLANCGCGAIFLSNVNTRSNYLHIRKHYIAYN